MAPCQKGGHYKFLCHNFILIKINVDSKNKINNIIQLIVKYLKHLYLILGQFDK